MKTVTETFDIYTFDELTDKAKQKAISHYEQNVVDCYVFADGCLNFLHDLFPHSHLEVDYDLSMGQGDYFNFYGSLDLDDLYTHISSKLSPKQIKFYRHILKEWADSCEIPCGFYVHSTATDTSILDASVSAMEEYGYSNIPYSDIETINVIASEYLSDVCRSLKNEGYSYFYPDVEYIREYYNDNEYYFTADGKPYYS